MRLKGKTALIAGAGRNNGKAIALTFAREGADLVLVARERKEELSEVAQECERSGVRTLQLLGDLSKYEGANAMVRQSLDHFGQVDVLVAVAGLRPHRPFVEITYEEWHRVFDVNLHAAFY